MLVSASHLIAGAFAGDKTAALQTTSEAGLANAVSTEANVVALRDDYMLCLKRSVKRYNDGTREAALVAEMTTHACTPALYEIRWTLLDAGTAESDATAYAAKLQVRAREKLAEMVEYGF